MVEWTGGALPTFVTHLECGLTDERYPADTLQTLSKAGRPLSELLQPFRRYWDSGEINSEVRDPAGTIERVAAAYPGGKQDREDGLTVELDHWWLNVRPSNTEPLLRLNLEAKTQAACEARTAEVLGHIREA